MTKNIIGFCASLLFSAALFAQAKPEDTEYYTPVPPVVKPGTAVFSAPADAIWLFDGKSLNEWVSGSDTTKAAGWTLAKDAMTVNKKTGDIQTKRKFVDYQLHLEYMIPENITGQGQARGNSGVFGVGIDTVGAKNKYQIFFRIDPDHSSRKARMTE